jgi:uncharacterized iron-regulated protein
MRRAETDMATRISAKMASRHISAGLWVCPKSNERRDDAPLTLAKRDVVLLGETHDQAEHHRWQLNTITELFGHRPNMVLGFEMFPRHVQPVLDRWSKGELNATTFMLEVDWAHIWGFAEELYLPLFHFARMHRLPMLALNIDRATNRRVAAQGLASVPITEREGVGDPAPATSFYRDRLSDWFKKHPGASQDARVATDRFERFVCAQQFWDRAMAEAVASARRDPRQPMVVGIMGAGHIEYGCGVPHQLAALGIHEVATALPWPANTAYPNHDPPISDFLFGMAPAP